MQVGEPVGDTGRPEGLPHTAAITKHRRKYACFLWSTVCLLARSPNLVAGYSADGEFIGLGRLALSALDVRYLRLF